GLPHLNGAPALNSYLDHSNHILRSKAVEVTVVCVQGLNFGV
ncbi:hypothetical protein NGA_0443800, partial [Nannochloropsis gaditana CCMP526]